MHSCFRNNAVSRAVLFSSAKIVSLGFLLVVLGAVLITVVVKYPDFAQQRRHLKLEVSRTTGKEQKYWKKKLRQTWFIFFM